MAGVGTRSLKVCHRGWLSRVGRTAVLAAVVAGCGAAQPGPPLLAHPSEEQAQADLARVVRLAQERDFAALCAVGSSNCLKNLDRSNGRATVPLAPPIVVGSRDVPDRQAGSGWEQGGRLLEVCGVDGAGKAYRTKMLFFGAGDSFTVIEALYWTGITFAETPTTDQTTFGLEATACATGI